MNAANVFAVEKAEEKALVISDDRELGQGLRENLASQDIEVIDLSWSECKTDFHNVRMAELDYCVVVISTEMYRDIEGRGADVWMALMAGLTQSTRIYIAIPIGNSWQIPHVPAMYQQIYFSDYISKTGGSAATLDQFLTQIKKERRLIIPGDGLADYPLLAGSDVARGIALSVIRGITHDPVLLVDQNADSLLSVAYKVRSLLPFKIEILFNPTAEVPTVHGDYGVATMPQHSIGWKPEGNYQDYLSYYIDEFFARQTKTSRAPELPTTPPVRKIVVQEKQKPTLTTLEPVAEPVFVPVKKDRLKKLSALRLPKPVKKKPLPMGVKIALHGLVIATSLYAFTLMMAGTISILSLKNLISQTSSGGFMTQQSARVAKIPAIYLQANLTALSLIPGLNGMTSLQEINRLWASYILALDVSATAGQVAESSQKIMKYVVGDGEGDIVSMVNDTRLNVSTLYDQMSLLDGSMGVEPPEVLPAKYHEDYKQTKVKIQEVRRASLAAKSLLAIAPDILGVGDRRKYAVLFQNNMELRPTGGFIGSFGLVSLENSKLFDIQVLDVYSADGQLKGHVEPPAEIKEYLGEANWFLRDSNWDPDFPTSARRVEWFLDKTVGADVQGVIGINLFTLQDVLRALGSVHLPDYNEDITADNLFERAEYHSEVNFFPGSTAKKEFIASLSENVIGKLRSLSGAEALSVARAIAKSIDEKNTTLAVGNSATEKALGTLGWNGELRDTPCPDLSSPCTSDYAMVVDSNFGINKANYFVKRKLHMDVVVNDDYSIAHKLKVEYTNTARTSAWPAGVYKNYSRLYVPLGSVVSSVKVGDKRLSADAIKITTEQDRTVAGFLVEVPLDSTVPVEIEYRLAQGLSRGGATYSWYWQKQSGTTADPLTVRVKYPKALTPEIVSPKAEFEPGSLDFSLSNVTDRRITIKFK